MSNIGNRMKSYEKIERKFLTPNMPVIIRVDGKAFHSFTKSFNKPFDQTLISAMTYAMMHTANSMSGFKVACAQSDECSFLITDYDNERTEGWFGYNLSKIVSITASTFSVYFNKYLSFGDGRNLLVGMFDARAFTIPKEDIANYFIWRQRDWTRNSLQMLARSHFSHQELHKKNTQDMYDMLHRIGVNWSDLSNHLKNGRFYFRNGDFFEEKIKYEMFNTMIQEQFNEK